MDPSEYSAPVFKRQECQLKHHVRSFANYLCREVKTWKNTWRFWILEFDNDPLPELYNAIYAEMYRREF